MFLKLFFELGIMLGVIRLNPLLDLPNSLQDTKAEFIICSLSARFKTSCLFRLYEPPRYEPIRLKGFTKLYIKKGQG